MTDTTTRTTAEIVRAAIMETDNFTGYDTADLDAGWRTPAVRKAGMQAADDFGDTEMLFNHFTYGEDGCPAVGYQSLAEEIAAEVAEALQDYDAISIARDIGAYPNADVDTLDEFIRDPRDNGPGFGTSLNDIEETIRAVGALIEDTLPEQWEDDDADAEYNDAAADLFDALEKAHQDMHAAIDRAVQS